MCKKFTGSNFSISGLRRVARAAAQCVAPPQCQYIETLRGTFLKSACSTPTIDDISPNQGSYHEIIHIQGTTLSNITCANEVRSGLIK